MTSSFTYTTGSAEKKYLSNGVEIGLIINGEQVRLIDGVLDQDVRDIAITLDVSTIWEQVDASDKSPGQLWLDLLNGSEITFKPDSDESVSFIILPDLDHVPTVVAISTGIYLETVALRFLSKSTYQPTDSTLTGLVGLMPFNT